MVQWLRICLSMQGAWVQFLAWEDSICLGAIKPMSHNYRAYVPSALASQQKKPQWEAPL